MKHTFKCGECKTVWEVDKPFGKGRQDPPEECPNGHKAMIYKLWGRPLIILRGDGWTTK